MLLVETWVNTFYTFWIHCTSASLFCSEIISLCYYIMYYCIQNINRLSCHTFHMKKVFDGSYFTGLSVNVQVKHSSVYCKVSLVLCIL